MKRGGCATPEHFEALAEVLRTTLVYVADLALMLSACEAEKAEKSNLKRGGGQE